MRRFTRETLIVFFILFAVANVYWPTLQADFVPWDDDTEIYQNPHLEGINVHSLHWMFTDVAYVWRYQPLTWLTWSFIHDLQGLAPLGYHLANLLFHGLNTVLVFFLIRQLLLIRNPVEPGTKKHADLLLCACGGALFWGIHPLRAEPVAWVSGFLHCQSLSFLLISTLCYLRSFIAPSPQIQSRLYWSSVVSFAASLLSYPIGIGFVVVLAALDFYPLNRFGEGKHRWWNQPARKLWLAKVPFILVAFAVTALGLLARFNPASAWPHPLSLHSFSLASRAMQAFYIWAYYVWRPFFPVDLSPFYANLYVFQPAEPRFLASLALVAILTIVAFWQHNRWRLFFVAWVCHLAVLVPVLGLTEHPHFPSDRYSLISAIIWAGVLAALLFRLSSFPFRRTLFAASAVILLLLGFLSLKQTMIWRDGTTLFTHVLGTVHTEPYVTTFQVRLASALEARMNYDQALAQNEALLAKYPDAISLKKKTADLLLRLGRTEDARNRYRQALLQNPENADLHSGFGVILALGGDFDAATNQFWEALRLDPKFANAYHNLALVASKRGQPEEAARFFAREKELSGSIPQSK